MLVFSEVKSRTLKHYKLLRRLGSGTSGTAYLADDTKLLHPEELKSKPEKGKET
jgi:hypothetical protein